MRKKRKLQGMTLVEIIISMFIFSVIALMMVQIGVVTKNLLMNSNHVNNKTSAESPIAAARDFEALQVPGSTEYKEVTDNNGAAVEVHETVEFTVKAPTKSDTGEAGERVVTQIWHKINAGAAADESGKNCNTNFDGDLEFYVSDDVYNATEPTTNPNPGP